MQTSPTPAGSPVGASPGYPHEFVIDLAHKHTVGGLIYMPRTDSSKGRVKDYEVSVSLDDKQWSAPLA